MLSVGIQQQNYIGLCIEYTSIKLKIYRTFHAFCWHTAAKLHVNVHPANQ